MVYVSCVHDKGGGGKPVNYQQRYFVSFCLCTWRQSTSMFVMPTPHTILAAPARLGVSRFDSSNTRRKGDRLQSGLLQNTPGDRYGDIAALSIGRLT